MNGVHIPKRKGRFWGYSRPLVRMAFWSSFVIQKCIRLVREKFVIGLWTRGKGEMKIT